MTPSQSQNVLHKQISNCQQQLEAKTQEGQELIKNNDRPSKLKTIYQQVLKLDDSFCILLRKRANLLRDPELFNRYEAERLNFLQTLNADWLPYIHGETNMTDQQNQTAQLISDAEPNAAKISQSVVGVSQRTVESGNPNKGNDSKASCDKRAKKAEKLAALEKDFAAKMRLKKIEFELKWKELEMEMQLFEEEGALKLEYEKEALDARATDSDESAAPSIRSRAPFNWKTPKNKDVSGWLDNSDKFSKLHDDSFERAKTRIDNNYPRVSFNREGVLKSRSPGGGRVSSAREQDKFKRDKPSSSSQLPKLKLSSFDGNPLEWPEWSNMFKATVHHRDIPDSEKMSHLKTLLTGKAKSAISETGYSGEFYALACELLGRKFGRPYLIVDAQLNMLRKQQPIRMHNLTAIISYSITISNVVNVLKQYNYEGDLQSSSTLQVAIEKLPPNLKEKWFFFVDECQEDRPDLTLLEKWLARMAFVHEGMPSTKSERKEDDRPNANKEKRFSKSSNVTANETKQMQNNNCPLAVGTRKIWNCPIFKNMNVTDRYAAVRKERLCYGCLGKGHAIKDCKVHPCGLNGCTRKHNRLLHSENQMDEGSHAVNVSAATINQSNQVTSFLQIVPVSLQSGSNRLTTYAFLDSGTTVSFIDQSVKDQLQAKGTDVTLNLAGIHGTQDLRTKKLPIAIKGLHSKVHSIEAFAHPSISLGNTTYHYKELKNKFRHLNVLTNRTFNLMEVGIILGQDAYEIQRPLDYKIGTQSESFAVLTELGWVVSGPMTGKKSQNVCHFAFTEDVKVAENIQSWWDIETYASKKKF